MLAELLASAGIDAWYDGAMASCLGPLFGTGAGARLLVDPADAERARELVAASGLFRGEVAAPASDPTPAPRPSRVAFSLYPVLVALVVAGATLLQLLVVVE